MKRFSILTKTDVEEDFIETADVWLSISEAKRGYLFHNISNSKELVFLISREKEDFKLQKHSSLREVFYSTAIPCMIYINSERKEFHLKNTSGIFTVFFNKKEKIATPLVEAENKYEIDDCILGFDSEFNLKEETKLTDYILSSRNIANLFLKELLDFLVTNQKSARPLFVINFTEHSVYKFSMVSNMKAVLFTIDMIKNKIIKYNSEKLWQIETVLHEAFVNAVTHGNELEPKKSVDIKYELGKRGFRIFIKDMGKGFDVNNLFFPEKSEALDAISGRGIYLMQKLSDILFYSPEGNRVLIFFNF